MALPKNKTLRVVCNPFAAPLDHEGRVCGAFPHMPSTNPNVLDDEVRHVGAVKVVTELEKGNAMDRRLPQHDIAYHFSPETQTVLRHDYYRRAMLSVPPELYPADEDSYAYAHGTTVGFEHPHVLIARKVHEMDMLHPEPKEKWEPLLKEHIAKHQKYREDTEANAVKLRAEETRKAATAVAQAKTENPFADK